MAHLTLSPPSPQSQMLPTCGSNGSSCGCNGASGRGVYEKLGADLETLIQVSDKDYSDLTVMVDGRGVPVHRCILAVRCPVFRKVFAELETDVSSKPKLELSSLTGGGRIGYDAFMTVIGYVYGGKMRPLMNVVECYDPSCVHVTCRPAINFVLELLCASSLFDIPELKTVAQQHLTNHMERFEVDDVMHVLASSCIQEGSQLQALCLQTISQYPNLTNLVLEKELSSAALEQVVGQRAKLGLNGSHLDPAREKQCKRIYRQCFCLWRLIANLSGKWVAFSPFIMGPSRGHWLDNIVDGNSSMSCSSPHQYLTFWVPLWKRYRGEEYVEEAFLKIDPCVNRALDSDDIELVQLLLDEKKLELDDAHALHYAAAYCDPKTLAEVLELGVADINFRNQRGLTVLHVAVMRREPEAIANLLAKGARLHDVTPDGRTATLISKRLTKKSDCEIEECQKDRLCIEILQQAEHVNAIPKPTLDMLAVPLSSAKELKSTLLYLENRVALARLLFPREASIVMGIAHLDSTSEFTGVDNSSLASGNTSRRRKPSVDLNEVPVRRLAGLAGSVTSEDLTGNIMEPLMQRCIALRTTVEMGHRFFPCCSEVIDKYVADDDLMDMTEKANSEEEILQKRRYVELKEILQNAFLKDKADLDKRKKPRKLDVPLSSSSSTSSSRGSLVTKL